MSQGEIYMGLCSCEDYAKCNIHDIDMCLLIYIYFLEARVNKVLSASANNFQMKLKI